MRKAFFILFICTSQLFGQVQLNLSNIDFRCMPTIRMKVQITKDGLPYHHFVSAPIFTLSQDGTSMDLRGTCSDDSAFNSIAVFVDNSPSIIQHSYLNPMKAAVLGFLDSLRPADEAAIYSFTNPYQYLDADFTTDKSALADTIQNMSVSVNYISTCLDAMTAALNGLSHRAGKKALIALTDLADPFSITTMSNFITLARSLDVRFYFVGFGMGQALIQRQVDFATEADAIYYTVFGASDFQKILGDIASDVTYPGCMLEWTSPSCTTRDHVLHVTAEVDGSTLIRDTVAAFPWRPDTLLLNLTSPASSSPGQFFIASVMLDPRIDTNMVLTYHFQIVYDTALFAYVPQPPLTANTISANGPVSVVAAPDGILTCSATEILPARESGKLLNVEFYCKRFASLKTTVISLDSVFIQSGCINVPSPLNDTVTVCDCAQYVAVSVPSEHVIGSNQVLEIPISVSPNSVGVSNQYQIILDYDPQLLTPLRDPVGASFRTVSTESNNLSTLVIDGSSEQRGSDSAFTHISFLTRKLKEATTTRIQVSKMYIYATCTSIAENSPSELIMIDGICTPLVVYNANASLATPVPNPSAGFSYIPVKINMDTNEAEAQARVSLTLFSETGKYIREIYTGTLGDGLHNIPFRSAETASGRYLILLSIDGRYSTTAINIVH
jgi:hypothetical protein